MTLSGHEIPKASDAFSYVD